MVSGECHDPLGFGLDELRGGTDEDSVLRLADARLALLAQAGAPVG